MSGEAVVPVSMACHPWKSLQVGTSATRVGQALLATRGAPLSVVPAAPAHRALEGSPAIVLERVQGPARDWYRVLAADGSLGWISGTYQFAEARAVFGAGGAELTSKIVAANTPNEDLETYPVAGETSAEILGASDAPYPEQMRQLGTSQYLGSDWLPWLRVRTKEAKGWLAPSDTELIWWSPVPEAPCSVYSGMAGLVRREFLANAQTALLQYAPRSGQPVRYVVANAVQPWPSSATCRVASSAVFESPSAEPTVSWFECTHPQYGALDVLALRRAPTREYFVVDPELRTRLVRYERGELSGAGDPELALQVGLQSSHGEAMALLVFGPQPNAQELGLVPLESDGGLSTWTVNVPEQALTIATASVTSRTARLISFASGTPSERPAHLAVLSVHGELIAAQRRVLATPGSLLVALDYPVSHWAAVNAFGSREAACADLRGRSLSPAAGALAENRGCKLARPSHASSAPR